MNTIMIDELCWYITATAVFLIAIVVGLIVFARWEIEAEKDRKTLRNMNERM